jgi:pilus assembly protein Flp/PilA
MAHDGEFGRRREPRHFFQLMLPEPQNACRSRWASAIPSIAARKKRLMERHLSWLAHGRPMKTVRSFLADETAATAIEYCLIASGIALGIFVAVAGIEAKINAKFTAINSSLK